MELNLLSYRNPSGQDQRGACCDATALNDSCLLEPYDTCDTLFNITLRTGSIQPQILGKYTIGVFEDSDVIIFPTCQYVLRDRAMWNPLVFNFSMMESTPEVSRLELS